MSAHAPPEPAPPRLRSRIAARVHVCPVPSALSAASWRALLAHLSPRETARVARLQNPDTQRHYVFARVLLRRALARCANIPPAQWRLEPSPTGRLEVVSDARHRDLGISLSHCPGWAACVVATSRQVGIDIERVDRPIRATAPLMGRMHQDEQAALLAVPPHRRAARLVELWTFKEAFAKALGVGLALPLSATAFTPLGAPRPKLADAGESDTSWRFGHRRLSGGLWVTVALSSRLPLPASWWRLRHHQLELEVAGGAGALQNKGHLES